MNPKTIKIALSAVLASSFLSFNIVTHDVVIEGTDMIFESTTEHLTFRDNLFDKCENECSIREYETYVALIDYEIKNKNKSDKLELSKEATAKELNDAIQLLNPK